ncbi:E3 ubiquitin-protein ligase TRAIP [Onthophagus taurus]|uniref:E3 ubiquitin-protein ligase TRAIP n=1 Tax=Onthophagus taurus TaxID=166361 RepID=UPI0039BDBA8A
MSFTCIICSDILNPTIDIYATTCGHIFHYICLIQWLQRSKSCPQCRCKVTEKDMIRLYVTSLNTSGIVEDVGSLQIRLDNALFQIKLKDLDIKKNEEKMLKEKKRNELLRTEIQQHESDKVTYESVIRSLKDQVQYFKTKVKDFEQLRDENKSLSIKIKDMQNIDLIISGCKDQVTEMLKYDHDPKSLSLMVQTLKKELVENQRKHRYDNMTMKVLHANITQLKNELVDVKKEFEDFKENKGRRCLAPKLKPTNSPICLDSTYVNKSSDSDCFILDSPKQPSKSLPATENAGSKLHLDLTYTPAIKSSSVGLSCIISPVVTKSNEGVKKTIGQLLLPKTTKPLNCDYHYDGMGGHSKDVRFPEPQLARPSPGIKGFKRHQSAMKSINKHKVRKLAAKGLSEYVNKQCDDDGDTA